MSLYIETPQQVCLDTTYAKFLDLDIYSSSVVVIGKSTAVLNTLKFTKKIDNEPFNIIFVDKESKLHLTNLRILNSLLVVFGELKIRKDFIFDEGQLIWINRN